MAKSTVSGAPKASKKEKVYTEPTRIPPPRSSKPPSRAGSPVKRDISPVRIKPEPIDEDKNEGSEMSSRRTTRGTSKLSEVSGATAATGATGTPRRRARQAGPLPAVGTRTSNAYGTNSVQTASRVSRPEVSNHISGVLDDLLNANSGSPRAGRSTASPDPRPRSSASSAASIAELNRTFQNESGVFGEAHIASSVRTPSLSLIEEERDDQPSPSPSRSSEEAEEVFTAAQLAQEASIAEVARAVRIGRSPVPRQTFGATVRDIRDDLFARLHLDPTMKKNLLRTLAIIFGFCICFVLFFSVVSQLRHFTWYGFGPTAMRHNLGQLYASGDLDSLQSRVTVLERDVYQIQRKGKIHEDTIHRLQSLLPDFIVGTKDKSGRMVLPNGLWQAIESKIESEHPLASGNLQGGSVSASDIENQISKSFERFVKSNDFKSKTVDTRFSHLIEKAQNDNVVISKSDAINLIRESWDDHKATIKAEMATLRKDLDHITQTVSRLEDGPRSKAEIQQVAKDVFAQMLPNAQLAALSKANRQANLNYGLTRVNHFSRGTGAVIDPQLVSPNFMFPEMELPMPSRFLRAFFKNPVPISKGPLEALSKWEEHGDCWCTPSKETNPKGEGPSLAVIMGSSIFPEEVVIEHIQSTAAIEPGSAPKEMELLAFVSDMDAYVALKRASATVFPELDAEDDLHPLPKPYVRVAAFTYDINASNNIQAFPVQLDTKVLGIHTNKLVLRARSNWGALDYTCIYRARVHGKIAQHPAQE